MCCPPAHDSRDEAAPVAEDAALVNAALQEQNAALQTLAAQQQALIVQQQERIAELERKLGLNSDNSGKPPSSDGLTKKPARTSSLRERSGKKPGGQKGHPGKTLCRTEHPDATIDHFPETCSERGGPRRRDRTGAIWRPAGGGRGVSAALSVAAREASGGADGRSVRRASGDGHHRGHEPELRRAVPGLRRH